MKALSMPNWSRMTLEIGARQLVVQLGVGQHVVLTRVIQLVVDTQSDGDVFVLGRRGNDDFLGATAVDVGACFGGVGEETGRFHYDVGADIAPAQVGRGRVL
jgi:hypothetical protein